MFNIRLDARLMRHLLGTWRHITKAQNSETVRQSNVLEWNLTRLDSNIRIAHLIKQQADADLRCLLMTSRPHPDSRQWQKRGAAPCPTRRVQCKVPGVMPITDGDPPKNRKRQSNRIYT
jgi:hypothetical protein